MMEADDLGRLVDRYAAALVLYARQWCACPEDVVQEAFVKLSAQRELPTEVVPWLYKVVRNGARIAARAERRRKKHEAKVADRVPAWFVPSLGEGLDAQVATDALQSLPPEQREVLIARLWGGLTFEQIAALTGLSSSTAHRHYHAGLDALRRRFRIPCPNKKDPTKT
jgi:RNA polymerase sigma factor (sigma-70 family)